MFFSEEEGLHATRIRVAGRADLPAINSIIDLAVTSWDTTARIKRLALPIYQYQRADLEYMWLLAAEGGNGVLAVVILVTHASIEGECHFRV